MDEHDDLLQIARDGVRATEDGDNGRSGYLVTQVVEIMRGLSVKECEWLSIAVSNGAFTRHMEESPPENVDVNAQQTAEGEVWDI